VVGRSECGAENCKLSKLIPNWIFKKMCQKHDLGYFCGGPDSLRGLVDDMFYRSMKRAVRKATYWKRWFYYAMAWTYAKAVTFRGKKHWHVRDIPLALPEVKEEVRKYEKRTER